MYRSISMSRDGDLFEEESLKMGSPKFGTELALMGVEKRSIDMLSHILEKASERNVKISTQ